MSDHHHDSHIDEAVKSDDYDYEKDNEHSKDWKIVSNVIVEAIKAKASEKNDKSFFYYFIIAWDSFANLNQLPYFECITYYHDYLILSSQHMINIT